MPQLIIYYFFSERLGKKCHFPGTIETFKAWNLKLKLKKKHFVRGHIQPQEYINNKTDYYYYFFNIQ